MWPWYPHQTPLLYCTNSSKEGKVLWVPLQRDMHFHAIARHIDAKETRRGGRKSGVACHPTGA